MTFALTSRRAAASYRTIFVTAPVRARTSRRELGEASLLVALACLLILGTLLGGCTASGSEDDPGRGPAAAVAGDEAPSTAEAVAPAGEAAPGASAADATVALTDADEQALRAALAREAVALRRAWDLRDAAFAFELRDGSRADPAAIPADLCRELQAEMNRTVSIESLRLAVESIEAAGPLARVTCVERLVRLVADGSFDRRQESVLRLRRDYARGADGRWHPAGPDEVLEVRVGWDDLPVRPLPRTGPLVVAGALVLASALPTLDLSVSSR